MVLFWTPAGLPAKLKARAKGATWPPPGDEPVRKRSLMASR